MSDFLPPRGGTGVNRLRGFGFGLVILGWVILLADLTLSDSVLKAGSLVAVLALKADIVTLAQCLLLTGFGLAVLGALKDGFGALNRFFDAVLQRSSGARPTPMPAAAEAEDTVVVTVPNGSDRSPGSAAQHRDRNYVILPDGSVEVDTLLGTRIFATLDEARDFIR